MGWGIDGPLTTEQKEALVLVEREQDERFEAQVASYQKTAESILDAGAQVRTTQLADLIEAHHQPSRAAIKEAVRRVIRSARYDSPASSKNGIRYLSANN